MNSVWMNLERMKVATKNRELLGLEPSLMLKYLLERQPSNGLFQKVYLMIRFE